MKKAFALVALFICLVGYGQQALFVPQNIQRAYTAGTRNADGAPGKNYWQNKGRYNINISLAPPNRTITGTETITYTNNSPTTLSRLVIKLILNIHNPGTARAVPASPEYLTTGIHIDKYTENGVERAFPDPGGETYGEVALLKKLAPGDSVQVEFNWHYDVALQSGREGRLDSTSFFLAYFYPRVTVFDDTQGWDRMRFIEAQEFYNDFNDYTVAVTVPTNFLVWGTGNLLNAADVLQPAFLQKLNRSLTSDEVINVVTASDIAEKNTTTQNATNTWRFAALHISDMAFCISDHYVWDAASIVVDKATGRRASCQAAYIDSATNFHQQVANIRHSLDYYSNVWPGVPYPFAKSTVVQGFADMEYPMMANDSPQDDPLFQRFVTEHEVGHSYFPFYMGINEHRYGFMDEGWTTAFEYLIGIQDLGKQAAGEFFKQFRVAGWATRPSDETQIPIITPTNLLGGQALGHNEYGKAALAYLGLKDMLGDDLFRKSLHGFMQRWNGKHPLPWDMFNSFSNLSGRNLNWYFTNWFFSTHFIDVALHKVTLSPTGFTASVKNIGGFAIPLDIVTIYSDNTTDTVHYTAGIWEKNGQLATITRATKKKATSVKIENGIYMDADETNNGWGAAAIKIVPLTSADLDKYTGVYTSAQVPIKITISKEGTQLFGEATGQLAIELTPNGEHSFSFAPAGLQVVFDPGKKELLLKQGGGSYIFKKE